MAKKQTIEQKHYCRDCKHSRDYHTKDYKGEFFLCRCDYQKRSMFLDKDKCEHFERKGR